MRRFGIVTSDRYPDLVPDDRLLVASLARRGVEAVPVVWSNPGWVSLGCEVLVLRSPWDYPDRYPAFVRWLAEVERAGTPVVNPLPLVRWNTDKRYLLELEARGVPILPTVLLEGHAVREVAPVLAARGWQDAVFKPTVSCGAKGLRRITPESAAAAGVEAARAGHDMLVQEFDPRVLARGELSFVFFAGEPAYVLRKRAAAGDFRVQEMHGGSTCLEVEPPRGWIEAATRALAACGPTSGGPAPAYARVDALDDGDRLTIMEVELIEPSLYLELGPGAADRFADVLLG